MHDNSSPLVVKVSGHELDDAAFLSAFAQVIRDLAAPVIIVHGGGKEISTLQQQMGIEPRYIDGIRVTDAPSLAVVEMVLCGTVNTRLVRHLLAAGVDACGMSGVDRGLVRAVQMSPAMGLTGKVAAVRGDILLDLLRQGVTPVIAPVSLGADNAYNVNADHVAGAAAVAVRARRVVFLTNVVGVLRDNALVPALTAAEAAALIADGTIFGGMIPKVQTALQALRDGVPQAVITDLGGLKTGGGTVFSQ